MSSRTIPQKIREQMSKMCKFPGCYKPAVALHHTKRFAIFRSHKLEEIVPLCKFHHELVHAGLLSNEEEIIQKWNFLLPNSPGKKSEYFKDKIDREFLIFKNRYRK